MPIIPPVPPPTGSYGAFPPRGEGAFPSAGDIDVWWSQPGPESVFRLPDRRQNSTHIFGGDQATTVWRSAPLVVGSPEDMAGVPIGPSDSTLTISSSDIQRLPQTPIDIRAGQGSRRRIYAELHSLRMIGEGREILAGERFLEHLVQDLGLTPSEVEKVFRRSYGEVISWDLTGDPQRDLPADNHFNVFFAVKFPATSDGPAFTVFNKEPLVVIDLGVTALPPFDRVTIPQFPYDTPTLYFVREPAAVGVSGIGEVVAGVGGCCAHSVRIMEDLMFRPVNFDELAGGVGTGEGLDLRTGARVGSGLRAATTTTNQPSFHEVESPYIDCVFVPNGVTTISSTGLTYSFESTGGGGTSDAVRNGVSLVDSAGGAHPIDVQAPTDSLAYQPPQILGLGLGPNGGITFDIAALRQANPDFYLVSLVALEGLSRESPQGSRVRLRVLVDGAEVSFANNEFDTPGASKAVSIDLQTAQRFVTLVATSATAGGSGVFALFQLRGFGALTGETPVAYSGPERPPIGTGPVVSGV